MPEDPYKEVKRFSELTEEEIDIVARRLREISPKFQNVIRPEMEGGQEEEDYKNIVEHYGTCSDLIYLAMPLNAGFIAQQKKDKNINMEQSHVSTNAEFIAQQKKDKNIDMEQSHVSTKMQSS